MHLRVTRATRANLCGILGLTCDDCRLQHERRHGRHCIRRAVALDYQAQQRHGALSARSQSVTSRVARRCELSFDANGCVGARSYLALVCLIREANFEKRGLIDYNFNCFRKAIDEVFERK